MINYIRLRHAIVVSLAILSAATANAQNSDNGYCVPLGEIVNLENAVVIVKNHKINHYPLSGQRNHNFFDFVNGSKELHFIDWGGGLSLIKYAMKNEYRKKIALFTDMRHGGNHESILVECCSFNMQKFRSNASTEVTGNHANNYGKNDQQIIMSNDEKAFLMKGGNALPI